MLYNRKVNIVEPFLIMIIAFWVYKWTIASTSLICMVVFSVFILGYIICWNLIFGIDFIVGIFSCTVISIFIAMIANVLVFYSNNLGHYII